MMTNVQLRNFFNNIARVSAEHLRAIVSFIEAPYREWLYKHSEDRTILFNITMNNHFAMYKRIYEKLTRDKRLRIYFTDSFSGRRKWLSFLLEQGVRAGQILGWRAVMLRRWDVCIDPDYYSPLVLRPTKWIQLYHGIVVGRRAGRGQNYALSRHLRKYDRVFCTSKSACEIFQTSGRLRNNDAARVIGYPKLDGLVDGSVSRDEVLRSYGADPARLSVLYAPTWPVPLSLEQIGDEMIDLLSDGPWTLLAKLHPNKGV
jgi:hypothetical protein